MNLERASEKAPFLVIMELMQPWMEIDAFVISKTFLSSDFSSFATTVPFRDYCHEQELGYVVKHDG